jgi:hypothetical protein
MKRIAAFLLSLFIAFTLSAQNGNEWINYGQPYVKIPIGSDGIYRVTYEALQQAGFPIGSVDAKKIQLYHRGNEQSVFVAGESDGAFDPSDYLEFYGRKNDGTLDAQLYEVPAYQPHQYTNIFSDTTSYFLTAGTFNGKRAVSYLEPSTGLSPESLHLAKNAAVFMIEYSTGRDYGEVTKTTFDEGEGWMGSMILYNQPAAQYKLSGILRQVQSATKPMLELMITGRGSKDHPVDIFVGSSNRLLKSVNISGFQSLKITQNIEWTDISGGGELNIAVKVNGEGTRVSVDYISLSYPQEIDMANETSYQFHLVEKPSGKSLIQIANAPANTRLFDITDPANFREIITQSAGTLNAVVRNTESGRRLMATSTVANASVKAVYFRSINAADYIIISHPLLRTPAGGYHDPVESYAAYRASEAGGKYDTLVVNIDQLYDQFNYGEQSPLAIFHFMKYLTGKRLPKYLFIIGKGLDVFYNYARRPDIFTQFKSLVPTAGYPGSDVAFTAGLNGTTYDPAVATGRITAMKPEDVVAYLNKVKETELRPFDDLRRKNVLHLSGGIYPGEPQQFRSYLAELAPIAENYYLGGKVTAIAKQSTDLKLINIAQEVNAGLDLVTFFGHSSPGTLDFEVGFATDPVMGYNNKGKYPVLLLNGCDAGSFFLNGKIFGEDWINAKDKGAIGFIAHSAFGFVDPLRTFSSFFYQVGYGDSLFIAKGLGDIHKELAKRYLSITGGSAVDITQIQQMILLGDPAVSLFGATKPDYSVLDENVSLSSLKDEPITAVSDSFALHFIVRNFGQASRQGLRVNVTRTLGDRSVITYDSLYKPVLYADTLTFVIRGKNVKGFGNNTFAISVDALNETDELREDNNIAYLDYFIPLNSTQNLYPQKFGIVKSTSVNLSFQHTDILSGARQFLLELDTSSTFGSQFKKAFTINATVLAMQPVTLLTNDTLVYYWRTKLVQPLENESKDWTTSSFTYINNGPEGWAQIEFPQFLENASRGLVRDATYGRIGFEESKINVALKTFDAASNQPATAASLKINNAEYILFTQGFGCRTNSFNLVAFDRSSLTPYSGVPFQWFNRANRACGRNPWVINNFQPAEMVTDNDDDIIQYVDNVPVGDSVVMFSMGDAHYELWPERAKAKLTEFGISSDLISSLTPGEAVVIFGRKGLSPGSAKVFRSSTTPESNGMLQVNQTITGRFISGEIRSVLIGPAQNWERVILKTSGAEAVDVVGVDVAGVTSRGTEVLLYENISSTQDITAIDAKVYPNLRLIYKTSDDVNLTAVQLDKWIVTYEPVTEGLIFYRGTREREVVSEGVTWSADYGFVNVSDRVFPDSLKVVSKFFNHNGLFSVQQDQLIISPLPGDTTLFSVSLDTYQKKGLNDVEVFVNPRVVAEQYYENNVFSLINHLNVVGELFNPVLDVSIDGRYIEKNEFVSANPTIMIRLWDENRNLTKKDTSGVSVFLAYPCQETDCPYTRINFTDPQMQWNPATETSDFTIVFKPTQLQDGTYMLNVEAKDQTGNSPDDEPYKIAFRVKNESSASISNPYPNPTKDQVSFNLLLTGAAPDVELDVEIMNVSGILINRLNSDNFQSFHVGNNVIHWEPRDGTGAQLPAGIYVYQLQLRSGTQVIQQRGKISIVR